ncbi:MAG: histone deacetylase family protein [Alphaproteobacteria bacterium]|nr:histone deacetylase family protein [Alphaproteobacteria bacterium]
MGTQLYTHDACARHDTGPHHVEQIARLEAVLSALKGEAFADLEIVTAPRATPQTLMLAHPEPFVQRILELVPSSGFAQADPDTVVSPESGEAALRAAGAVCAAVDAVIEGHAKNAFCAVRPPGHHAESNRAMGFCLFNNVAIGAFHSRTKHGLSRVAVVDFDVHHGNGTQALFWNDRDAYFGSTHQMPLYPGTGAISETGVGNIFNAPLRPDDGSQAFRTAMKERVLPALDAFEPELILISAGFDAHRDDPLGGLNLVEDDFAWVTRELMDIAEKHCAGRVVSALEGGYNLSALGASAAAHVDALMEA